MVVASRSGVTLTVSQMLHSILQTLYPYSIRFLIFRFLLFPIFAVVSHYDPFSSII